MGGVMLLSLAAIVFVLYEIFLADRAPSAAEARPPVNIPANARRFGSLADLERAGRLSTPFALTLTEAEINTRVQAELAKQPNLPFRDVRAKVVDDRIDFTGQADVSGVGVGTTVGIHFFPKNGTLGYEIQSISFGPVPVPGIARQTLQDQIDKQLAGQNMTTAWVIDEIDQRPGLVTIVGHAK
jgi:hypothetical protein